jgi:hypothetical protein
MAIDTTIKYAPLGELKLDPMNPRLGRGNTGPAVKQDDILDLMKDWSLEELAVSFLENGFWPQEALIVIEEMLYGAMALVVIEGNRRLAALMFLSEALKGTLKDRKWKEIASQATNLGTLLTRIPYIQVSSRKEVEAFLGFRHVTGIKEWKPAEKAEYISKLIEDSGMTYVEVMRKIGSRTATVRQNYISYRLLLQMESQDQIDISKVEEKFSVLFLSLRTDGVRSYLNIDIQAEPDQALRPVPKEHLKNLENFARWLFGAKNVPPIINDSRQVEQFGQILESKKAVAYMERTPLPSFDAAYQLAGGDEPAIVRQIEEAADKVEASLSRAHRYAKSKKLRSASKRLGEDVFQLLSLFPLLKGEIEAKEN